MRDLGIDVIEHRYPDHHRFRPEDVRFSDALDVIMTEKDAVKCRSFAGERLWYLAVDADVGAAFGDWLQQRLENISRG